MKGLWGSLICIAYLAWGIFPVRAEFWNIDEPIPLPKLADGEYSPPEWLNSCPVIVAGSNVTTTTSCLPPLTASVKGPHFIFDEQRRQELVTINDEFNAGLSEADVTLEQSIALAASKKSRLIELGWPAMIVSYAVVKAPKADEEGGVTEIPHLVLMIRFGSRAFVLDTMLDDILPWQYSPHRFEGAEVDGVWRPIIDYRDDPLAIALEIYE